MERRPSKAAEESLVSQGGSSGCLGVYVYVCVGGCRALDPNPSYWLLLSVLLHPQHLARLTQALSPTFPSGYPCLIALSVTLSPHGESGNWASPTLQSPELNPVPCTT